MSARGPTLPPPSSRCVPSKGREEEEEEEEEEKEDKEAVEESRKSNSNLLALRYRELARLRVISEDSQRGGS